MKKKEVGQRIREFRERAKLSQDELSARSGIALRSIQRLESEGNPTLETLSAIAIALNTTPSELLDAQGPGPGLRALFDVSDLLDKIANLPPVHRAVVLYLIYKDRRILDEIRSRPAGAQFEDVQALLKVL